VSQWVINGLRTGIKTTVYPRGVEHAAGVTPGLPHGSEASSPSATAALVDCCPTQVFSRINDKVSADNRRCIHCYRCVRGLEHPADWQQTYEWATVRAQNASPNEFIPAFKRSVHICVVDAAIAARA
jgi:ferredoxin-like protein FixX